MAHVEHVPADFESTFRHRFASLFGRKIARQRAGQYLGGLLRGQAERRNVTALAGTVDGATARSLGWLLNKSPWPTRPIVDALQSYVGDSLGSPDGLFTLHLDSFVKRGDNAVGVEKQYVHHLNRTLNCQIGVFLAYGAGQGSALVDAALYMPHSWIEDAARRQKAGVPASVESQPRSALALTLLRQAREAGHLPGQWVTTWHGEGFEPDLRARLDAEGWRYLLPVSLETPFRPGPDSLEPLSASDLLADETGAAFSVRRVWEAAEGESWRESWLLRCSDGPDGRPVVFVSNAPEGESVKMFERIIAARWDTARMLAARCAGVSLDVYRVRGWDGWHRHVALALLASAFRACLPPASGAVPTSVGAVPSMPAEKDVLISMDSTSETPESAEQAAADVPVTNAEPMPAAAAATSYRLLVDLADTDWRAVRAFQVWLVADEAGVILETTPTRAEIERQEVGPRMLVRFESELSVDRILAALDEVPEITIAELTPETEEAPEAAPVAVAAADDSEAEDDTDDLLAALQAELAARTSAREAGLMPVFEDVHEVVGNAVAEASIVLDESRELVAAQGANGHANGHSNGNDNGNGAAALSSLAAPVAPPAESPVRPADSAQLLAPSAPAAPAQKAEDRSRASEERTRPAEEQMVVLDVGEESYGIPVQRVREIIRVPPITRVPNGPAFLEGVINLRGQVIPVMDLRKHLGIPTGDETRRSRVVVSELGRHTVGLMVDGVSQVVMVSVADIEPPPSLVAGANDGQVCGVARLGEKLVLFLDPDRVLPNR